MHVRVNVWGGGLRMEACVLSTRAMWMVASLGYTRVGWGVCRSVRRKYILKDRMRGNG